MERIVLTSEPIKPGDTKTMEAGKKNQLKAIKNREIFDHIEINTLICRIIYI